MNYHNITKKDMLNGDGLRVVLWTAGCTHRCKGCQNPVTWDENGGILFDDSAKAELFDELAKDDLECTGITFSGGDPLHHNNREHILNLCKEIREKYPTKTIWLYTGYTLAEVKEVFPQILPYLDVLVDGKYDETKRNIKCAWKGSENQVVHYFERG